MKKRLMSILLILLMLLSVAPFSAFAETAVTNTLTYVNPLYADILSVPEYTLVPEKLLGASDETEYKDFDGVAKELRAAMVKRQAAVTLYYKTSSYSANTLLSELVEAAIAHTGVGNEGDYLRWTHGTISGSLRAVTKTESGRRQYYLTLSLNCSYLTTASEEKQVDKKLAEVIAGFELDDSSSDFMKIKSAYDYVCQNISYDSVHGNDYDTKYTAYGALIKGTAVCQGYASLMYDMLLHMGIDCRVIASDYHGWNIVKLGDVYYNIDSTWDAGRSPNNYLWFMKCQRSFTNHERLDRYSTAEFNRLYPMAAKDLDPAEMHSWGKGTVTKEASCTEAGEMTFTCTDKNCGQTMTVAIPALGHDYGEWTETRPATCSEYGEETCICERCKTSVTRSIEKLEHNYVDGVCTECGEAEKTSFITSFLSFFRSLFTRLRFLFIFVN